MSIDTKFTTCLDLWKNLIVTYNELHDYGRKDSEHEEMLCLKNGFEQFLKCFQIDKNDVKFSKLMKKGFTKQDALFLIRVREYAMYVYGE